MLLKRQQNLEISADISVTSLDGRYLILRYYQGILYTIVFDMYILKYIDEYYNIVTPLRLPLPVSVHPPAFQLIHH